MSAIIGSVSPRGTYEAGQAIGPYQLVRNVERDDTEETWLARRVNAAGVFEGFTLVLPPAHAAGDPRIAAWFAPLVQLAPWLTHPGIVRIIEQGEHNGLPYLVLEWTESAPLPQLHAMLAQLAASDPAGWIAAVGHIVELAARALAHAHACMGAPGYPHGIVHRQLSPASIVVTSSGDVKLRGFGVADRPHDATSGIHAHGMLRYVPSEQLGGGLRLPSLDVFALGAIVHELLDGRRFRGEHEDATALYRSVMSRTIPALSRAVPPEVDAIRTALLQPEVAQRPRDGAAVLALMARWPRRADAPALCASAARGALEQARRPESTPLAASSPPPAAPRGSPPAAALASVPPPAAAVRAPTPVPAPSASRPPAPVDEEGTVELDQAVLAAMRAAGRTGAPPGGATRGDAMMLPPGGRRGSGPHPESPAPSAPPPAAPRSSAHAPSVPLRAAPVPSPTPSPAARAVSVAPPRAPEPRAPEPLVLQPSYEPTTTTMLQARRGRRTFVIVLLLGVLAAIGIGAAVGYWIVGEDAAARR